MEYHPVNMAKSHEIRLFGSQDETFKKHRLKKTDYTHMVRSSLVTSYVRLVFPNDNPSRKSECFNFPTFLDLSKPNSQDMDRHGKWVVHKTHIQSNRCFVSQVLVAAFPKPKRTSNLYPSCHDPSGDEGIQSFSMANFELTRCVNANFRTVSSKSKSDENMSTGISFPSFQTKSACFSHRKPPFCFTDLPPRAWIGWWSPLPDFGKLHPRGEWMDIPMSSHPSLRSSHGLSGSNSSPNSLQIKFT